MPCLPLVKICPESKSNTAGCGFYTVSLSSQSPSPSSLSSPIEILHFLFFAALNSIPSLLRERVHCPVTNRCWGLLFIMKTKSMMTTMPMMAMMTRALPHVSRYPQVEAEVPLLQRALQLLTIFGAAGSRKLLNGGKYFHLYN